MIIDSPISQALTLLALTYILRFTLSGNLANDLTSHVVGFLGVF